MCKHATKLVHAAASRGAQAFHLSVAASHRIHDANTQVLGAPHDIMTALVLSPCPTLAQLSAGIANIAKHPDPQKGLSVHVRSKCLP